MEPYYPFKGQHRPPSNPPPDSELLEARAALKRTVAHLRAMEQQLAEKDEKINTLEAQKMSLAFELEAAKATAHFFRSKLMDKRPREPGLLDPEEKTKKLQEQPPPKPSTSASRSSRDPA